MNIPPNLSQQSLQPMQQPPPQQQIPQYPQEKFNNISKVKSLIAPLRESLASSLKTAAQTLHQNINNDNAQQGPLKGVDDPIPRYDKNMEEFYSICDQIELNLKTSIECTNQISSSQHYLPINYVLTRTEPIPNQENHSYPQYLCAVRSQIHFTHELHELLRSASQSMIQPE